MTVPPEETNNPKYTIRANRYDIFVVILSMGLAGCGVGVPKIDVGKTQNTSKEAALGYDPSVIYKDCKKSLANESFRNSMCEVTIMSAVAGISMLTYGVLLVDRPNDPCNERENNLIKDFQHRVCVSYTPEGIEEIAKKYVAWYESEDEDNQKHRPDMSKTAAMSLVMGIFDNYECENVAGKK